VRMTKLGTSKRACPKKTEQSSMYIISIHGQEVRAKAADELST